MREQKLLKKRSEMDANHTWNLTALIKDHDEWQSYYKDVTDLANNLKTYEGKLSSSAALLYECLCKRELMGEKFSRLYTYSFMKFHEDTALDTTQEATEKVNALQVTVNSAESFIEPELLSMDEATLLTMVQSTPSLQPYEHYLDNLLRQKSHILPSEQEKMLALLSDFSDSPSKIFSLFNDADIKFPDVIDEAGNPAPLTKGNYVHYLESSDPKVREIAFKTLYATYKKHENTLAAIFTSQLKKDVFMMRARHYNSTCEASLFENNINVTVYDNLIDTVNNNLDLLHRYVGLRKKILKVDELHLYDLYMPMIPDATVDIPYDEAKKTVLEALSVMGEDYTNTVQKAFDEGWIDVYENEGKRSGAYSWGTYSVHPYILLNHQDNIKSMFTLAHEIGHTMHSFYSSNQQPYLYASYPIFLAEVASTVNESLLMQHLLKTTTEKNQRLFLLNHYMESFRGTLYRQVMFAEYEKATHVLAEEGEAVTADRLSKLYYELNQKYYGTEIVIDEEVAMEWARIPHFYYNYYVYQYATGFSSAIAIAKNLLDDPDHAVDNYKLFLSSGCSQYPLDTLLAAGVDMTTSEPIENALKVFESVLDEMESLIEG